MKQKDNYMFSDINLTKPLEGKFCAFHPPPPPHPPLKDGKLVTSVKENTTKYVRRKQVKLYYNKTTIIKDDN